MCIWGREMGSKWFCVQPQRSAIAFRSHEAAGWQRGVQVSSLPLGLTPFIKKPAETAFHTCESQPVNIRAVGRFLHHRQPSPTEYHTALRQFKVNYAFLRKNPKQHASTATSHTNPERITHPEHKGPFTGRSRAHSSTRCERAVSGLRCCN